MILPINYSHGHNYMVTIPVLADGKGIMHIDIKSTPAAPAPGPADVLATVEIKAGEFKNTCLQLMDDVRDHPKQYVITKHGRPVAKLVPPDVAAPSGFGCLRGTIVHQDDIVSPDFEAWGEVPE